MRRMVPDRGLTLIELLVVLVMIAALSLVSINSFKNYKERAFYATAVVTLTNARKAADASIIRLENPPAAVPAFTQSVGGVLTDAAAQSYLEGLVLQPDTRIDVTYRPNCGGAVCLTDFIQVRHCDGRRYTSWSRFANGTQLLLEDLPGTGCS